MFSIESMLYIMYSVCALPPAGINRYPVQSVRALEGEKESERQQATRSIGEGDDEKEDETEETAS